MRQCAEEYEKSLFSDEFYEIETIQHGSFTINVHLNSFALSLYYTDKNGENFSFSIL